MRAWVLAAVLASRPLAAAEHPARRVIDVHMHAEPADDPRFGSTWTSPLTGRLMTAAPDEPTQMSASLEAMRQLNIVKSVVSGPGSEAMRWRERAPDKVIVMNAIYLDEVRRDLQALGVAIDSVVAV